MNTTNPQPPSPGAQDATSFLAMVLAEILEVHARAQVHDLFLRDILEKVTGQSESEILEYQQIALKTARRNVYKTLEGMMSETFPEHLSLVQTLYREI